VLCLLLAFSASAQETVVREVVGSGGGTSSSGGFQLSHTVGQALIGAVTEPDYQHGIGFWYSPWFYITGDEEPGAETPAVTELYQNYPNPFNPVTNFRFALAKDSRVVLRVYDALGRTVDTVIDGQMEAGIHSVPYEARGLSSGVYFYRIQAEGFEKTKKMVLLR
jgi:hypothetical protein